MSTNDCDNVLAKLIDTIVNHEKQIEEIKLQLANNEHFSPFTTFRSINASQTGFLTEEDLNSFFRFYGYSVSKVDLKRLVASENHNSKRVSYNDFLNQILPMSDIDLRNEVLKRAENKHVEISEQAFRDIGRLITAIYQNEIEHLRALEIDRKRLLDYDVAFIDVAFLCLSDDVSCHLSYKSIVTFMKRCGFTFGKSEYECFIRRIDQSSRGRISVTDFKHFILPLDAIHQLNGYSHQSQVRSTIEGISPIKSLKASSAKKDNGSDYQIQAAQRTSASILKKSSLSPTKKYDVEADIRIPAGQPKNSQAASQVTFNDNRPFGSGHSSRENFHNRDNQNIYQTEQYRGASSNRNFYNHQMATIQDNLMYQNVPELDVKHPLENRFLDPLYHNYWSYSRQHNTTLSPEYLNKGEHSLKSKINPALYYNPTFLEPGSYENPTRYPENPFRHTDHGHYFQNYYNGLRSNFYDQYYNFIPYKTKAAWTSKAQSSASKSLNSPMKSDQEYNESQYRQSGGLYRSQQVPDQESPYKKSPSRQGNSSRGLGDFRGSNQYNSTGEYKMSLSQAQRQVHEDSQVHNRSAIKIDSEAVQREQESPLDAFMALNQPVGDVKPDTPDSVEDLDNKPYKYVIVHS